MESQPQNPEFRNNPDNFHPCKLFFACNKLGFYTFQIVNNNSTDQTAQMHRLLFACNNVRFSHIEAQLNNHRSDCS